VSSFVATVFVTCDSPRHPPRCSGMGGGSARGGRLQRKDHHHGKERFVGGAGERGRFRRPVCMSGETTNMPAMGN